MREIRTHKWKIASFCLLLWKSISWFCTLTTMSVTYQSASYGLQQLWYYWFITITIHRLEQNCFRPCSREEPGVNIPAYLTDRPSSVVSRQTILTWITLEPLTCLFHQDGQVHLSSLHSKDPLLPLRNS